MRCSVHVRVFPLVEPGQPIDNGLRFLGGGRVVEPHERTPVDAFTQNREVLLDRVGIEQSSRRAQARNDLGVEFAIDVRESRLIPTTRPGYPGCEAQSTGHRQHLESRMLRHMLPDLPMAALDRDRALRIRESSVRKKVRDGTGARIRCRNGERRGESNRIGHDRRNRPQFALARSWSDCDRGLRDSDPEPGGRDSDEAPPPAPTPSALGPTRGGETGWTAAGES